MQVTLTLPVLRGSTLGQSQGHFPWELMMCFKSLWVPWRVTLNGEPLHPSGFGGWAAGRRDHNGRGLVRRGVQVQEGRRSPVGTFTGRPHSARRQWAAGVLSLRAGRPAARPPLPLRDPAASRPGAAGGKAGGAAAAATRAAEPARTKGGCVHPGVRKRGAGGGPALRFPAYCSPRAHPHALSKKLTHPAAAHPPTGRQTEGRCAGPGVSGEDQAPDPIPSPAHKFFLFLHRPW
jgi:hypothetical protein